ncbi:MAG: hypothetical protein H6Q17_335 [Bacteroidetes bacterium]|nr:hypothetical protein [Bacteroidota bacterium]
MFVVSIRLVSCSVSQITASTVNTALAAGEKKIKEIRIKGIFD